MPRLTQPTNTAMALHESSGNSLMLPLDHPHTQQHLQETIGNRTHDIRSNRESIKKSRHGAGEIESGKRTRSSKNLMSLLDRKEPKTRKGHMDEGQALKKSKSSTSLSAIFSRPASSKGKEDEGARKRKDKENQTPPETPIWAQLATQKPLEAPNTTKIPLNDRISLQDEMKLYTPQVYSPSKQRNFENEQPKLSGKSRPRPRPKSECLPSSAAQRLQSTMMFNHRQTRQSGENLGKNEDAGRPSCADDRTELRHASNGNSEPPRVTVNKRGSRVMAAVAAFNGKSKELPQEPVKQAAVPMLDPKAIETAFESLLDARNVPQNTRDKMRSLDTNIKADFIKQDKTGTGSASSTEGLSKQSVRPNFGKRSKTDEGTMVSHEDRPSSSQQGDDSKKSRPRSRTFTFNKGDSEGSPTKKQKSDRPASRHRSKSGDLKDSESTKSLSISDGTRVESFGLFGKANVFTTPDDCIKYLRQTRPPPDIEIGKIHKLRQLLRNETVEWVNKFITDGGMTEVVDLLYRIIAVEWREEHEDSLLHETLSCLKALSTTSLALVSFTEIHGTLFPALIGLLYSEEKKGPSEFTTRTIIVGLLHTYLSRASAPDISARARTLLSYMRDPLKPEAAQLPGFITTMHHPRPYRVWQKEISDVTKEVFWIFLHQVNVIPYPSRLTDRDETPYIARHFPQPHPPIPTAPYIGGVEWEATTYLTTHIDLLNGFLASLPTRDERNALRQELKDSSFEKVMGATLRTCKEKFYGSVHEALSTWVGAAKEDGWEFKGVREGALPQTAPSSPRKGSPNKKKADQPPKLEMPNLDFAAAGERNVGDGGWL